MLAKRLRDTPAFNDPSALTASQLQDLGASLAAFPKSFTDQLDPSALSGALDQLKDVRLEKGQVDM